MSMYAYIYMQIFGLMHFILFKSLKLFEIHEHVLKTFQFTSVVNNRLKNIFYTYKKNISLRKKHENVNV